MQMFCFFVIVIYEEGSRTELLFYELFIYFWVVTIKAKIDTEQWSNKNLTLESDRN